MRRRTQIILISRVWTLVKILMVKLKTDDGYYLLNICYMSDTVEVLFICYLIQASQQGQDPHFILLIF